MYASIKKIRNGLEGVKKRCYKLLYGSDIFILDDYRHRLWWTTTYIVEALNIYYRNVGVLLLTRSTRYSIKRRRWTCFRATTWFWSTEERTVAGGSERAKSMVCELAVTRKIYTLNQNKLYDIIINSLANNHNKGKYHAWHPTEQS